MENQNESKSVYVRLPVDLCQEGIKKAAGVGLFYLSMGNRPDKIPTGSATAKTRVQLSVKAQEYLQQVIAAYGSQNAAVVAALAFVAEKPLHVRNTII